MQPTGGMKHVTNNKEEKKEVRACERAIVRDLPSFQVIPELRPGLSVVLIYLFTIQSLM